jgi:signal transduction histidine kinase
LRGPFSAIANGVHIVTALAATNPQLASVAGMMSRQSHHMRRLLDDLLDLARITRNRLLLSRKPTDMLEQSSSVLGQTGVASTFNMPLGFLRNRTELYWRDFAVDRLAAA